jgi:glycosyltransferase involved in cell wall biosynthesis
VRVVCVLPEAKGRYLEGLSPQVGLVDLATRRPITVTRKFADFLRQERPIAIIASQQHTVLAALWARRLAGVEVPVTFTQHATLSALCRQSRRPTMRWLMPLLARLFFPWADQVCAVSQGVARDLAAMTGIPESSIRLVCNPAVTPDMGAKAAMSSGHPWLDAKDRPVVLGVGSLIRLKDFATLVRAFARVRSCQLARLVIVGEGEERLNLLRLARDLRIEADIDLPGFEPNPLAIMARADLFVLSSRVEGFSNAIVEALACGCPVVSTDCPDGPAEVLEWGKYGRLVPVGDDVALSEAIMASLREPADRDRLRQRADNFSVERAVEQYLELLQLPVSRDGSGVAT